MPIPPRIRQASLVDLTAVETIVAAAYRPYVARMPTPPAPMLDDYEALIERGVVWLALCDDVPTGVIVMWPNDGHLYIDNIATDPTAHGAGIGTALLAHADRVARAMGVAELRLYTNEAMTENLDYYPRRGFAEVGRRVEAGYDRVYFRRRVPGATTRALIRDADDGDLAAIAALHSASWHATYGPMLPEAFMRGVADRHRRQWRELPTNGRVIVADDGDSVVGFAATLVDPQAPHDHLLDNLHVDPAGRSSGIGARLLDRVLSDAADDGATDLHLWVFEANVRARGFYRRNGGHEGATRIEAFDADTHVEEREVRWRLA